MMYIKITEKVQKQIGMKNKKGGGGGYYKDMSKIPRDTVYGSQKQGKSLKLNM